LEKDKISEEDSRRMEITGMEYKVKQLKEHLEEALDARNGDELRELQVTLL
jgi:hypothetical protein